MLNVPGLYDRKDELQMAGDCKLSTMQHVHVYPVLGVRTDSVLMNT